ncbi:MAG: hypothetical protein B7Z13_13255 [Caulobacterales bacterium 32-67-6]|nr:MAG: hypothetical protein B7Z13_13255 [Caulobacterales bacterium 32-67-6]
MDEFKRVDPNVIIPLASTERRVEEVVVIQRESSAGWWAVGILCALALVVVVWLLTRPTETDPTAELRLSQAEAAAADAQETATTAIIQNRVEGARDSVAIAQAEAMEARAEAVRATQQARAAEARAASGLSQPTPTAAPATGSAVVTTTSPQP